MFYKIVFVSLAPAFPEDKYGLEYAVLTWPGYYFLSCYKRATTLMLWLQHLITWKTQEKVIFDLKVKENLPSKFSFKDKSSDVAFPNYYKNLNILWLLSLSFPFQVILAIIWSPYHSLLLRIFLKLSEGGPNTAPPIQSICQYMCVISTHPFL
jgi:hypothetical protein